MLSAPERDEIAQELLLAREGAVTLSLISARYPGAALADAYAILDRLTARREALGEQRCGYKIGFTNRTIWPRYGVFAPIWAPVWRSTVSFLDEPQGHLSMQGLCQPRLEPEIVFGFGRSPRPGAAADELLGCIDWVAHGFEIVHTHWDGWRFMAVDAVADFGLHGRLLIGPRLAVQDAGGWDALSASLASLGVTLHHGDRSIDHGVGANVLDGPVQALHQWWTTMGLVTPHWRVEADDVVTTGTITDAAPISAGQTWHSVLSDARWPGLTLQTHR